MTMMIDISTEMREFKEATRHTWNTYFWPSADRYSDESQVSFVEIERGLLKVLVLSPHGMDGVASSYRSKPLAEILVVPRTVPGEMPVNYGQKHENGNTVWELPVNIDTDEHTLFEFYDFYDWQTFEHLDLAYVRASSIPRKTSEEKIGRIVMIEHRYCNFLLKIS